MSTRHSVAIIGLGLIGGSLALALRRAGWRVAGTDASGAARAMVRRRRAGIQVAASIPAAIAESGVVVICVPPRAAAPVLRRLGRVIRPGVVVTDACSVKRPLVAAARRWLPDAGSFVGAHPMAGSEKSGMAAAHGRLFHGRAVAVTPVPGTRASALRTVERLWRDAGGWTVRMTPTAHDRAVAVTSHLPHLLAYALAATVDGRDARRLVAGSFLDATRVARSDPALWADILAANRREVARALRALARTAGRLLRSPGPGGRSLRMAAARLPGMRR